MFNLRLVDGGTSTQHHIPSMLVIALGLHLISLLLKNYFNLRAGINYERNHFFPDSHLPILTIPIIDQAFVLEK